MPFNLDNKKIQFHTFLCIYFFVDANDLCSEARLMSSVSEEYAIEKLKQDARGSRIFINSDDVDNILESIMSSDKSLNEAAKELFSANKDAFKQIP